MALEQFNAARHHELGNELQDRGELDEAIAAYRRALRLDPAFAEAWNDLGTARYAKGELEAALDCYRRAVRLRPDHVVAHANLGATCRRLGLVQEARHALQRELVLRVKHALGSLMPWRRSAAAAPAPTDPDPFGVAAHVRQSVRFRESGRLDEAEAAARAAIAADDESPAGHTALGATYRARGKPKKARECYERALELDPGNLAALRELVAALREDDRIEEAERRLRAALRERPDEPVLLAELGLICADELRYTEALEHLDRAPDFTPALHRKALILDQLGSRAQAHDLLQEVLRRTPNDAHAQYNLGLHRLKYGDFERGWEGYEARRKLENFVGRYRRFPLPEWDGAAPLEGRTVLVLPEQGLGDEIMFASCIPDLAARAGHVILECDPKLEKIFQRSFPACTVVSRQRTAANDWITRIQPRPEVQVPAGSLARRFRTKENFLKADPAAVAAWRAKLGPGRHVGISWRGGVALTGKKRRSFSLQDLAPLLRTPGVQWVNLQYNDVREELKSAPVPIRHFQEAIDDYDQTAALVCALDGVVTVCTAVVHLAGGLGRPALVMVPFAAEWRYGASGERMLWYPSVRLIRQRAVGQWSDVLQEVARRLASNTFS